MKHKRKNLKKLLKENMRRFKTKNLNESGGSLQQASPDPDADWEGVFNSFSEFMGDHNQRSNQILGWWLEVYSAMADTLAYYAEQLMDGQSITQYQPDILKIIDATDKCIHKFQTVTPDIYKAFLEEDCEYMIRDIRDDLIGELKDLLRKSNKLKSYALGEKLEPIADAYQEMSEEILHVSWDLAHDSENPDNSNINKYSQN
jgi:hypothetical protein